METDVPLDQIPYKLNFRDLSRLVEDLGYLAEKNGLFNVFQLGGKMSKAEKKLLVDKLLKYIKLFFVILFLGILIYVLLYTVFKGYLRSFVNVGTMSFKHKAKLDDTIKERNVLVEQLRFLGSSDYRTTCHNPFVIFNLIHGNQLTGPAMTLHNNCKEFEKVKDKHYEEYVNDERYFYALKDFFLFSNHINVDENGTAIVSPSYKSYLLAVSKMSGEFAIYDSNGKKRSNDEQMAVIDREEKYIKLQKKHPVVVGSITKIAHDVQKIQNILFENSPLPYIVIPKNDGEVQAIMDDFIRYSAFIKNGSIYNSVEFAKMSDIGWYLVEYMSSVLHRKKTGLGVDSLYNTYANDSDFKRMPLPKDKNKMAITYFMGLSRADREIALNKLLFGGSNLKDKMKVLGEEIEKLASELSSVNNDLKLVELSQGGSGNYEKIQLLQKKKSDLEKVIEVKKHDLSVMTNQNQEKTSFLEFIQKHPIFSYIYFSFNIPSQSKPMLYDMVMKAYTILCECKLDMSTINISEDPVAMKQRVLNLQANGANYKQLVNAVGYLHMFLNMYRKEIALGYKKQNITEREFFMEMWTPFKTDFIENRLVPTAKSTFALSKHFKTFKTQWDILGDRIKESTAAVYKAFFTSTPIEKPRAESLA